MYYVYILFSDSLGQFYTGHPQHLVKRHKQHLKEKSHWTSRADDWREVWHGETATRTEAAALERKIKKRGARRFLSDVGIRM